MRQTSVDAYNEIKENGLLSALRFSVYDVIFKHGPLTQGECWKFHFNNRQRHDIGPRFAELLSRGVIVNVGERPCKVTGVNSIIWQTTDNLPIEPSKKESNAEKIKRLERTIVELNKKIKDLENELFYSCK